MKPFVEYDLPCSRHVTGNLTKRSAQRLGDRCTIHVLATGDSEFHPQISDNSLSLMDVDITRLGQTSALSRLVETETRRRPDELHLPAERHLA